MYRLVAAIALFCCVSAATAQQFYLEIDGKWYSGADLSRANYLTEIWTLDTFVDAANCRRANNAFPQFSDMTLVIGAGNVVELVFGEEILYFVPKSGSPAFFSMATPATDVSCTNQVVAPVAPANRLQDYYDLISGNSRQIFVSGFER